MRQGAAFVSAGAISSRCATLRDTRRQLPLECPSFRDKEVFGDWAERERGQILQQRHNRDHGQQESNEQRAVSWHELALKKPPPLSPMSLIDS